MGRVGRLSSCRTGCVATNRCPEISTETETRTFFCYAKPSQKIFVIPHDPGVWLGDGHFGFTQPPNAFAGAYDIQSAVVLDFNLDGKPDLVILADGFVQKYVNDGTGKFSKTSS